MTDEDMTDLEDKKGRQEVLDGFTNEIATTRLHVKEAHQLREKSTVYQAASLKGLWALAYMLHNSHEDMLTVSKTLFEIVFSMYDDYCERIAKIQKEIDAIAENTDTDITKVTAEIHALRETLPQTLAKLNEQLKGSPVEEKKQKLEDEILDWATRSH